MTLNEFVLTSLEKFESYAIQKKTIDGKLKDEVLTKELYEKLEANEIENYYLDINKKTNQPYIVIKLVEEE